MTAQPTADSLHLVPEEVHMGHDPAASAQEVANLVRTRHAGQTVLVVGHSTTVNRIVAALGGPPLGDICETAYSNVFTLVIPATGTPRLAHRHYGAADPAGGHECVDGIHVEDHHGHH
jgi:phosphohistidine phosphatase SixA